MFLLNLNKSLILLFLYAVISLTVHKLEAAEKSFPMSYYGSILSGQIANYNNDTAMLSLIHI